VPQRIGVAAGGAVGVEGVDAVIHGGHVNDVVDASSGNGHGGEVERLADYLTIDGLVEELAELIAIDILRSENGFVGIGAERPLS